MWAGKRGGRNIVRRFSRSYVSHVRIRIVQKRCRVCLKILLNFTPDDLKYLVTEIFYSNCIVFREQDKNSETNRYLAVHQYVENLPTNANTTADILLDIWQRTGKYHHNHAVRAPINVFPADSFMHKFVEAMNKEPLEANKITIITDEQQCSKIKKSKM